MGDDIKKEIEELELKKAEHEKALAKYWYDTEIQIQLRESINYFIGRIGELQNELQHDR